MPILEAETLQCGDRGIVTFSDIILHKILNMKCIWKNFYNKHSCFYLLDSTINGILVFLHVYQGDGLKGIFCYNILNIPKSRL